METRKEKIDKYTFKEKETIGNLFDIYKEELYKNTDINTKLAKQIFKEEDKLYSELTEQQKQQYEKVNELKEANSTETEKRIFVYAYSLATRLILESMN